MGFVNQTGILTNFNTLFSFVGPGQEQIPASVNSNIQPVIDINPFNQTATVLGSVLQGASGTLYTTPTSTDTYITSLSLNLSDQQVAGNGSVTVTIGGNSQYLFGYHNTNSKNVFFSQTYNPPILIDRNTTISYDGGGNDLNITVTGFNYDSSSPGLQGVNYQ